MKHGFFAGYSIKSIRNNWSQNLSQLVSYEVINKSKPQNLPLKAEESKFMRKGFPSEVIKDFQKARHQLDFIKRSQIIGAWFNNHVNAPSIGRREANEG